MRRTMRGALKVIARRVEASGYTDPVLTNALAWAQQCAANAGGRFKDWTRRTTAVERTCDHRMIGSSQCCDKCGVPLRREGES